MPIKHAKGETRLRDGVIEHKRAEMRKQWARETEGHGLTERQKRLKEWGTERFGSQLTPQRIAERPRADGCTLSEWLSDAHTHGRFLNGRPK